MKALATLELVLVWNHPASTHEVRAAARYVECRHNSNVEQESSLALSLPVCLCLCLVFVFSGEINQVSCLQLLHKAVDGIVTIHERESNSHVVKCSSTPRGSVH